MAKKLILDKYEEIIEKDDYKYKLGMITEDYVFYYLEGDEDILMFDRDKKLISDNYFGQGEFSDQCEKLYPTKGWVWADENTQYNAKCIYEERIN